jgi:hypothetical protein
MSDSEIMRRPSDARTLDPFAPSRPKAVQRSLDRTGAWALTNAAHAQAVGYVTASRIEAMEVATEQALLGLDRVTRLEAAIAKRDPINAERAAGFIEDFVFAARHEIRTMSREF